MNIGYRLKRVLTSSFFVNNVSYKLSEDQIYTFDIGFSEAVDVEEQTLSIVTIIHIYLDSGKKHRVVSIQTETTFTIVNFQDLLQLQDLPAPLTTQLLGIAISTTRGILLTKCADTAFGSFVLPIINPTELYKAMENTPSRLIEQAKNYFSLGNSDRANEFYSKALDISPGNLEALYNRASLLFKRKEHEKALEDINRFLEISTNYSDAYFLRALIYDHLDLLEAELKDLDICLKLSPQNALALNTRANCYRLMKRFDEAKADAEKAIELNPELNVAYGTLAEIYGEQGEEELFYEYLEKALQHGFDIQQYMDDPAYYQYKGQDQFKKLIKKYSSDPVIVS